MRARGADIRDIANRVIRCLLGLKTPDPFGRPRRDPGL